MLHRYCNFKSSIAFSTTRHNGVSKGQYATFNANHYCGDDPKCVEENRQLLCNALGIDKEHLIVPHQNHGTRTVIINDNFLKLDSSIRQSLLEGVDAVCTNIPNVCVCVSTADCIPVLVQDTKNNVVSAIHAGWRGTVTRIVEKNIKVLQQTYGTDPADCIAAIGPGISLEAFEVGDEVYNAFKDAGFDMQTIAKRYPIKNKQSADNNEILEEQHSPSVINNSSSITKWHIDLPLCNKQQLIECGLKEENIFMSGICTYNTPDDFFSARRLGIKSGRILNGIMRISL